MDFFGAIPVRILLEILKLLPSLPALQSLRRASPAVDRLLHEPGLAAEVLEAIITSTVHYDTQVTIRFAVHIAWGPEPGNFLLGSPDKLRESIWGRAYSPRWQRDNYSELAGHRPLTQCPTSPCPTLAVLRIIALSTRVHELAHACFHTMLERVLANPPRGPGDPSFSFTEYERAVKIAFSKGAPFPNVELPEAASEPIPVLPSARAAPSWGEDQRLQHDAWAYALDCILPTDPASEWARSVRQVFEPPAKICPKWWAYGSVSACLPDPAPETLREVVETLASEIPVEDGGCTGPPLKDSGEGWQPAEWGGEQDRLLQALHISTGASFIQRSRSWDPWSPVFKARSTTWRRLGLEQAWSRKRLEAFGFLPRESDSGTEPRGTPTPDGKRRSKSLVAEALFAWRSVLPADEVQVMRDRARLWWAEKVVRRQR